MLCPRCKTDLAARRYHDTDVHVCEGCRGMFLTRGALNKVAEPTRGDLEFSTIDLDTFEHEDRFGVAACPACRDVDMRKVEFNIHTGITLDWCNTCGAFWLDGEEIDRINEEVRRLNEADRDLPDPKMLWFARFIWTLPR